MTDPGFVGAAYLIVFGGLGLYVAALRRRVRAARQASVALERERERDEDAAGAQGRLPPAQDSSESAR